MTMPVVIGSRSPRRLELLQTIVERERLTVLPPLTADEPGFDDLSSLSEFETRILQIVELKLRDVCAQLQSGAGPAEPCVVVCADTTVIVEGADGRLRALGQPPAGDAWPDTVRQWFREFLAGKTHLVLSGVSVARCDGSGEVTATLHRVSTTRVTMRSDVDQWLDWYVSTGEPVGKAGGYAVQGAGSVFVTTLEGSYSNVVGLPIENTAKMLREIGALSP